VSPKASPCMILLGFVWVFFVAVFAPRGVGAFTAPLSRKGCSFDRETRAGLSRRLGVTKKRSLRMDAQVGIVGATGAVGREILGVLEARGFPVKGAPALFGSKGGQTVEAGKWGNVAVRKFDVEEVRGFDVVFLAASGDFALKYAEEIAAVVAEKGIVVDNSSALRLRADVPLVVPEVNGELCASSKLVANPNCTTAIAMMALYPIFAAFGLKKVIMSTYQAASGAGAAGMAELRSGVADLQDQVREDGRFNADKPFPNDVFAHPLPFNVIPHIDSFQPNLYTKEEMKVTWETKKILGFDPFDNDAEPRVSCTAVRIPTLRAHSEAITVETRDPVTPDAARRVLEKFPGVAVVDDPDQQAYPMPLSATGLYDVEVGRIRQNLVFGQNGLDIFVSGDQLLRGAALNAVLIAEKAINN